jgi:hypothetical protein
MIMSRGPWKKKGLAEAVKDLTLTPEDDAVVTETIEKGRAMLPPDKPLINESHIGSVPVEAVVTEFYMNKGLRVGQVPKPAIDNSANVSNPQADKFYNVIFTPYKPYPKQIVGLDGITYYVLQPGKPFKMIGAIAAKLLKGYPDVIVVRECVNA